MRLIAQDRLAWEKGEHVPITWLWLGGSGLALVAGGKLLGVDHDLLQVLDVLLSEGHPW